MPNVANFQLSCQLARALPISFLTAAGKLKKSRMESAKRRLDRDRCDHIPDGGDNDVRV